MKQLKALASVVNKKVDRITPYTFLQRVFMHRSFIYAANSCMVVEVECNEISMDNPNYYNWVCLDLEACQQLEKANRFVNLNDPAALDFSDDALMQCERMGDDYFSRFYDMKLPGGYKNYNPDLLQLACKVFKAFNMGICPKFNINNDIVWSDYDSNYHVRIFIMPKR